MNSSVFLKILACLCFAQLLASCSPFEVCDENGVVYTYLLAHGAEIFADYTAKYGSLAHPTYESIFFSINGETYGTYSIISTENQKIILSVSTNEGYNETPIGNSGYFYTATGELDLNSTFETHRMSQYIFCYRKIK